MKPISSRVFKFSFLFLLAFVIFYSVNQSKSEEVYIIEEVKEKNTVIDKMISDGIVKKDFSYYVLKLYLSLGGNIEPGGYVLKKGMGAVSTILTMKEPEYRYVYVNEGERKGQIADRLGKQLDWTENEIKLFANQENACELIGQEGFLASGKYLIHKDEDPIIVQLKMQENYLSRLKEIGVSDENINKSNITTIASLIQREAYGKSDMRLVSGVIWNRLSQSMPLQIDATLQYIKGEEGNWWPVPEPEDKYLESDLNTYQNVGLPNTPIATPGEDAILAAMNPLKTDCLYYIHDERGMIHCSSDYEGHKRNIEYYLK
jgi:UPF0755 protein